MIEGRATIFYRSGADSSLPVLYLHAYPNAFSSASTIYARERERQGEDYDLRFAKPRERGWMAFDSVTVDGSPARLTLEETIAAVRLPRPLRPNDSLRLFLRFAVQVPKQFDRFGHTGDNYSVAQWYPKMVVYDEEGWHPDPFHYMAEFYGDYGTYDVSITLPDDYWVGATGVLTSVRGGDNEIPLMDLETSRDSVSVAIRVQTADSLAGRWPTGALRVETDLLVRPDQEDVVQAIVPRDGAARLRVPRGAPVHYAILWEEGGEEREEADRESRARPLRLLLARRDTTVLDTLRALAVKAGAEDTLLPSMKTLRFRAERVHDFAWVASPEYVRGDTVWGGISVRSLALRDDQGRWVDSKRYVVDALRHHTAYVGPYVWPQFTTTEARCGGGAMEYPMLIMNEPDIAQSLSYDLDDTIAHEVGHNWFYGMLGSDERAHPWMDEGFTQWIEDDYTDHKYPRGLFRWARRFPWLTPNGAFTSDELSYLARAWARDERPISTPAEKHVGYPHYGVAAYSKPVAMLRTLRGVIGDSAFAAFLHRYYRENLFRHPRPADVRHAAERASGRRLDGFFRSWLETTERAGFALGTVRTKRDGDAWRSTVAVRRTEQMVLPVVVQARFADGTSQEARVLARGAETIARFQSRARLVDAILDPRHDIVEINRLDNGIGLLPPMRFRPLFDFPQSEEITVLYGPTLWHGRAEGARVGAWFEGRYLPSRDFPRGIRGFEGGMNVGTRAGATAWRAGVWRRAGAFGGRGQIRALGARDEGLFRIEATLGSWVTRPARRHPWHTWWVGLQYRDRDELEPVDSRYWSPGRTLNGSAGVRLETVGPRHKDRVDLEVRRGAAAFREGGDGAPDAQYDWARLTARRDASLLNQRIQLTLRGTAASAWRRVPREQLFDLAEGSRLDGLVRFYENDRGPLRASGHYTAEGGGGIRGFTGRAALGQQVLALNLDLTHADTGAFLFADVGRAEASGWGDPLRATTHPLVGRTVADLGVGYSLGPARIVVPAWVSHAEPGEAPWKARWLVSLDLAGIHPWW